MQNSWIQTDTQTDTQKVRQTDKDTARQTDKYTDQQTVRQTMINWDRMCKTKWLKWTNPIIFLCIFHFYHLLYAYFSFIINFYTHLFSLWSNLQFVQYPQLLSLTATIHSLHPFFFFNKSTVCSTFIILYVFFTSTIYFTRIFFSLAYIWL